MVDRLARLLKCPRHDTLIPMQSPGAGERIDVEDPSDRDLTARAAPVVRMLLRSLLIGMPLLALLLWPAGYRHEAVASWTMSGVIALLYLMLARGRVRAAFCGLVLALIVYAVVATATFGSIRGTGIYALFGAVFVAGILFGRGALALTVIACVISLGGLIIAERSGYLGARPDFTVGAMQWINHAVVLGLLGLNIGFVRSLVITSLARADAEAAERRRAEQALGSSEQLFGALFRDSPAALIVIRRGDGEIVDINQAYEATFGVHRADIVGRRAVAVDLWSSAGERDALLAEIATSGRIAGRRMRFRRSSGVLFESIVSTATLDWRGAAHHFSSITDVSAEAAANHALKQSEERFSKAFDFSPIGLIITRESDGRYIEVNSAEERTLGHARATLLGRTSLEVGPWRSPEHRRQFIDLVRRDGRALGYDTLLRNKAGELVDCRLFAERIEMNGEPCVLTATINISEQKRQESLILQIARGVSAETGPEFFRSLALHLGAATGAACVLIAEVGPAGRLDVLACRNGGVDATPAAPLDVQSFGLAPILGSGGVLVDPPEAAAFGGADDPLGISGMRGVALACLAAPDGVAVGVLCAFAPAPFAEPSRVEALFRIFAARTQAELMRLRAERALLAINRDLEARVGERTARLQEAIRELEAFSYSVAHDLRAPLRAIDGFLNMLVESASGKLAADDRGLMDRVLANCARMNTLISDLLDLSRISRIEVRRERVDLSGIARDVIGQLQQAAPQRMVRSSVADGLAAHCDPALARIVLTNLLGNAWKFSAASQPAIIEFGANIDAAGRTVFFVRDNGVGFDMRFVDKLFIPFQRLHRRDEFEGSGIGLVTVARIVARHGGRVDAEGAPGLGATFRFTFEPNA